MSRQAIFSTPAQLSRLGDILSKYARLPFSKETIPGAVLEGALAHVRGGEVLNTYDFVDVIKREDRGGWQVKSTKSGTPVTWMRAKIPNSQKLIDDSRKTTAALQALGDTIINFNNAHVQASIERYNLNEIGYSRLIVFPNGRVVYFEKLLCTRSAPKIFNAANFEWRWSQPKKTVKKEQLPALHGLYKPTGKKWWAWHGLGENQLHFTGDGDWWPPPNDPHVVTFSFPAAADRIDLEKFIELLARLDA